MSVHTRTSLRYIALSRVQGLRPCICSHLSFFLGLARRHISATHVYSEYERLAL